MPFLELAEGGFLGLSEGGGLLLAESYPVAPNQATLYEINRIEDAFKAILQVQVPEGVTVYKKRESVDANTPRVEMVFSALQNKDQRYVGYASSNAFTPAIPLNAWDYQLQLTVVTNRTTNGSQHATIVGIVRWSMQYFRLLATWNTTVAPYHAITSIYEGQVDNSVDSDGDLDMERLSFLGIANIRDSAWPAL
jgi:hypothetical protein